MKWLALLLGACWSSPHPTPELAPAPKPRGPQLGVWMTPEADEDSAQDVSENQLYVSVWEENKQPVLGLLCRNPCLPNKPMPYLDAPESYRSVRLVAGPTGAWEATLKNGAKELAVRLDPGSSPAISFEGRERPLRPVNFQLAGYHLMSGFDESGLMVFTHGREIMIKPSKADTFLYLPADGPVQTLQTRNWRYRFEPAPNHDEPGTYFAVLRGEIAMPQGEATIELDIVRSPVSDLAFSLTRGGRSTRFLQSNDSNTHRFEACTGAKCAMLLIAHSETPSTCTNTTHTGTIAIWLTPEGTGRSFIVDDGERLLDHACRPQYALERNERKAILKDPGGTSFELVKRR